MAIDKPSDYFNTKLYTGNGSNNTSITGVGFQPDWVWVKARNIEYGHKLFDVVRGQGKRLASQSNAAESTVTDELTSFNSDGFTTNNNAGMNENNRPYVAWNWKAGTSFTNDASATGIGSIDSTGSVNTDAGFSIISYTGTASAATVAHGLGAVPKMIIVKTRGSSGDWSVYHSSLGNTKNLKLNTTAAQQTSASYWNNTTPTSSVFTINDEGNVNGSSVAMIAYCFAEKSGYSSMGQYTGNGNADGTFVYLGFKPAFLMRKRTDSTGRWVMEDNKRDTYNVVEKAVAANIANAEGTGGYWDVDFTAQGFKVRNNDVEINASGGSYIYMAFAENPFVTSTGVPATAR
jgi:hypothetical protein